jgi:hypothetical protein
MTGTGQSAVGDCVAASGPCAWVIGGGGGDRGDRASQRNVNDGSLRSVAGDLCARIAHR